MKAILRYILKREYTNKVLEKLMKLMWHKEVQEKYLKKRK